jgi:hypothetical protein
LDELDHAEKIGQLPLAEMEQIGQCLKAALALA